MMACRSSHFFLFRRSPRHGIVAVPSRSAAQALRAVRSSLQFPAQARLPERGVYALHPWELATLASCQSCAFPGYLFAACAIFCSIFAQARSVAVAPFDCASCLPEWRGSSARFVFCGECVVRWRRLSRLLSLGDNESLLARAPSACASISRRLADREVGFRFFSTANSRGCWVAIWLRRPAAWKDLPQTAHLFFPKTRFLRCGDFLQAYCSWLQIPFCVKSLPQ